MIISYQKKSHQGKVRILNEDRLFSSSICWAVFDGMGGHGGGDVAAELACVVLEKGTEQSLESMALQAHQAIITQGMACEQSRRMGCTFAGLKLSRKTAEVCWVGDSRVYVLSKDTLTQLSRDHSFVQDMKDRGVFDEDEARTHPMRSQITRCIGGGRDRCQPEVIFYQIKGNCRFLICSDGLSDVVRDEEIANILKSEVSLEVCVNRLIETTLEKDAPDNVSVIVIDVPKPTLVERLMGMFFHHVTFVKMVLRNMHKSIIKII